MYQQCRGIATRSYGCEGLKQSDFTGIHSDDGRLWGVCNHVHSYEVDGWFLTNFARPNPMWKQLKRWVQMHSQSIKNQGQSLSTFSKKHNISYLSILPLDIYPWWLVTVVPRTARQWHKAEMLLDQARKTKDEAYDEFLWSDFWSSSWLADVMISIYAFVTPFSSFFWDTIFLGFFSATPFLCWCQKANKEKKKPQVSMGADQSFALPFYEKLASHYGQSRQLGSRDPWFDPLSHICFAKRSKPKCVVDCQSIGCMYCIYRYLQIDYV